MAKTKKTLTQPAYTVDSDYSGATEMPSVTRLLNRKKLALTKTYADTQAAATIQPVNRRKQPAQVTALHHLTDLDISSDPDEALKGLSRLVHRQKGIRALLFQPEALATGERRKTSRIQFRARIAYQAGDSEYLWTGLAFQGSMIASLWNELVRQGWVELPGRPVSGIPNAMPEAYQFFRNFLGLKADDWAVMLVCGNPKECTGILVITSPHSRMADLPAAFPHLFKQGTKRIA